MTALISGRVQGVGFRAFVQREALKLGLVGEVWNNPDRSVGVITEGEETSLQLLEKALRRGPITSHVADCSVQFSEEQKDYFDFSIRKYRS
jgi:acylphosphatase